MRKNGEVGLPPFLKHMEYIEGNVTKKVQHHPQQKHKKIPFIFLRHKIIDICHSYFYAKKRGKINQECKIIQNSPYSGWPLKFHFRLLIEYALCTKSHYRFAHSEKQYWLRGLKGAERPTVETDWRERTKISWEVTSRARKKTINLRMR